MRYQIFENNESWVPLFKWSWSPTPGVTNKWIEKHRGDYSEAFGNYPAKWIARLSAWVHTRNATPPNPTPPAPPIPPTPPKSRRPIL